MRSYQKSKHSTFTHRQGMLLGSCWIMCCQFSRVVRRKHIIFSPEREIPPHNAIISLSRQAEFVCSPFLEEKMTAHNKRAASAEYNSSMQTIIIHTYDHSHSPYVPFGCSPCPKRCLQDCLQRTRMNSTIEQARSSINT